jgi:hypothetical protein
MRRIRFRPIFASGVNDWPPGLSIPNHCLIVACGTCTPSDRATTRAPKTTVAATCSTLVAAGRAGVTFVFRHCSPQRCGDDETTRKVHAENDFYCVARERGTRGS